MKTSKYKGVSYVSPLSKGFYQYIGKWRAQLMINGINTLVGYYDTEREAAIEYDKLAIRLGRPTNILRPLNG